VTSAAAGTGFIENRGQINEYVRYYITGSRISTFVTDAGIVFDIRDQVETESFTQSSDWNTRSGEFPAKQPSIHGCSLQLNIRHGNAALRIEAREQLETRYSFFLGNDPSNWLNNIPAFTEVVYHDVRPGVDLVLQMRDWGISYELVGELDPAFDYALFEYIGTSREILLDNDTEQIETPLGNLRIEKLGIERSMGQILWLAKQDTPSSSTSILDNQNILIWSTYLGGNHDESCFDLTIDSNGNPIVYGRTASIDFPTTPGSYDVTHNNVYDVVITKFNADGTALLWSTFIGGDDWDYGFSMVPDSDDRMFITGLTSSSNFPTTAGAYDESHNGDNDAFICHLSSDGSELLMSTYIGGSGRDAGCAIALDSSNNPIIIGPMGSFDFPVTVGAADETPNGGYDIFALKLSESGTNLIWSTFLGGSESDWVQEYWFMDLGVDSSYNPVITGITLSSDFPTTTLAYDYNYNGGEDIFVTKISEDGSEILWSTYYGGSTDERSHGVLIDEYDNVIICGTTTSEDMPTSAGALDPSYNGGLDGILVKLSSSGSELMCGTYLGGQEDDMIWECATGGSVYYLVGYTRSSEYPITEDAYDVSYNGEEDVTISVINSSMTDLYWSSLLGGSWARHCVECCEQLRQHTVHGRRNHIQRLSDNTRGVRRIIQSGW